MPAFRPRLDDARTLIGKSLDFGFCHESGKTEVKKNADGWEEPTPIKYPAPRITCNIVMHNENNVSKVQKIICSGQGIDERTAFDGAIEKLKTVPEEVLNMNATEMAQEIVRLRQQQAQSKAAALGKPTQNRPLQPA